MIKNKFSFSSLAINGIFYFTGFVVGGALSTRFKTFEFFNVKITDILSILATIGVGTTVYYLITKSINFDAKRRELVMEEVGKFIGGVERVYTELVRYFASPDIGQATEINNRIDSLNKQLTLIKKIMRGTQFIEDKYYTSVEWKFVQFKIKSTGGNFMSHDHAFTVIEQHEISASMGELKATVNDLRVALYT